MERNFSTQVLLILLLLLATSVYAQQPQPDDDVVRISSNLVQIDAVVTDKDGKPVTNLTAADFELLQDGKPQKITNFSYVNTETRIQAQTNAARKADKNAPLPPPVPFRSAELGRVLTFVVDDGNCSVTFGGMRAAREGLEKFVTEQMQPNDLVVIYQTRRGSKLLQQYTSDKARLLAIIRKLRWYPPDGVCSTTGSEYEPARNDSTLKKEGTQNFESEEDRKKREALDNFTRDKQTVGTIGVIRYAINGLQRIGGRKILFLLSDGLPISNGRSQVFDSFYTVRDLAALANRASVVINPIDVRGLTAPGALASDDFGIRDAGAVDRVMASRALSDASRQSGLSFIADETGGKFYKNSNFLHNPIQQTLKSEKGYYLMGYQPEEDIFKGKKFHKIEIKLKRPDLVVSSRSGFYGVTDAEMRPKPRTGDSELYEAIATPLPKAGLDLQLTAFFGNTVTEGSFVRTLLYLDGNQIAFTDEPNGMKKAVFDVVAVTLNEKNGVVDEFNRTHTLRFPAANLPQVRQNGLIYTADVPVKKAGAYNFRVAVRDATSKLLGSAGQQIDVPDLKKNDLFLSGLTIGEITLKDGKPVVPSVEKSENAFAPVLEVSNPGVRKFRPGAVLGYSYKIYNAKPDATTRQPKLTVQVRLFHDGQLVTDGGAPQPAQIEPQPDMTRLGDYGYLRLPPNMLTGDYALQIIIKDLQANKTVSQWIDFEVVK